SARLAGAVLLDFDTIGLAAADDLGELPKGLTRAAAWIDQADSTAMRRLNVAGERRHAFDDRRRSRVELRLRDTFKARHCAPRREAEVVGPLASGCSFRCPSSRPFANAPLRGGTRMGAGLRGVHTRS